MLDAATSWLVNPPGLTPHGFCLQWEPGLLWLHALSDTGTGVAYLTIPLALAAIVHRRPDLVLRPVVILFAAFVLFCGIGHWLDLLTLWVPAYGLEGLVKAATAITSIATAIALRWVLPRILAMPSSAEFRRVSGALEKVRQAEQALSVVAEEARRARDRLADELARREVAEQEARASEALQRTLAEALKEACGRLSLAADRGGIGIWEWDIVTDKLVWDPSMYRLYGMEPRRDIDPYEIWKRHLHPDDREATKQGVLVTLKGGQPLNIRYRVVWEDGSVHMIEGAASKVTRDENGRAIGMVGINVDVSERQIETEQRSIMIEAAPNGMMIVDEAGIITLANSQIEKIFDYPPGGLRGQPVDILVPDGLREAHRAQRSAFSSARSNRAMARGQDFIGRKRDGGAVTVEVMLSPVKTPHGRITVVSLIDSSERKRKADEQLEAERRNRLAVEAVNSDLERLSRHLARARDTAERANRAKSRFLAGISHELRTPLNGILGYAQILRMEGGLTEAQGTRVDAMLKAGRHLLEMITCVLDLSEVEADHVELQAVGFEVQPVAVACLDLIRPMAESKGLTLCLTVAEGVPRELVADPTRLRQVLLNLLGNAAKFTTRGSIELRIRPGTDGATEPTIRIEVVDTGVGIPAEQRERLFNAFERLDNEITRTAEGSGLGLALAARLATLMGGRLGYYDNPGGGSVFWLDLPLAAPATSHPTLPSDPDPDPASASAKLHVLVVDDVLMNRDIGEAFLTAAGHKVTCADDGAVAVALAADNDFDLILMDVRMPQMDGLEATRRIRALGGARGQVPIVALTAHAFSEQIKDCRQAGMDAHVAKPFDMETLVSTVARVAAERRLGGERRNGFERPGDAATPIINRRAFDLTAAIFSPEKVEGYMNMIAKRGESLLRDLHESQAVPGRRAELAETAHALAGNAAMFGFERLAAVGRRFEHAVQSDAAETPALAGELRQAVEDTLKEIHVA